jgi:hypothetical protein
MTQSMPVRSSLQSGPSRGSRDRNFVHLVNLTNPMMMKLAHEVAIDL